MHGLRWASTEYGERAAHRPAGTSRSERARDRGGCGRGGEAARGVGELVVGGVAAAAFLMGKTVTESAKASGVLGDVGEAEARAAERVSQAGLIAAVSLTHSPPCHPRPTLLPSILNPTVSSVRAGAQRDERGRSPSPQHLAFPLLMCALP